MYKRQVEGIVLLENDGCLPVNPKINHGKLALYGAGAKMTIKGGTGSGEVNERHVVSILEGMEHAGFKITTMDWIDDYDQSFQEGERAYAEEFRKKLSPKNLSDFMNLMSSPYRYPYGRAVPVSYTHLDVYKRQRQCRTDTTGKHTIYRTKDDT